MDSREGSWRMNALQLRIYPQWAELTGSGMKRYLLPRPGDERSDFDDLAIEGNGIT